MPPRLIVPLLLMALAVPFILYAHHPAAPQPTASYSLPDAPDVAPVSVAQLGVLDLSMLTALDPAEVLFVTARAPVASVFGVDSPIAYYGGAPGTLLLTADLAPAAPQPPNSYYVYLGHVGDDGRFDAPKFSGLPVVNVSNERTTSVRFDSKPVAVTSLEGLTLRAAPTPTGPAIGRLPRHSKAKLTAMRCSFGYVWGELIADDDLKTLTKCAPQDTPVTGDGATPVLSVALRSYAVDGFTGRSGTAPNRPRNPFTMRATSLRSGAEPRHWLRI